MDRVNNSQLSIYNNNTDYSNILSVFKGTQAISLGVASYLYIGFKKPLHTLFLDLYSANTVSGTITFQKYNGTSWETLSIQDDTHGLTKTGFIYSNDFENEALYTHQGKSLYWIRLSFSGTTSGLALRLLNLVFSSTEDLIAEESDIELYYPVDSSNNQEIRSFSNWSLSARDEIIASLNQAGKYKYNGVSVSLLTHWDILNINELRSAHKYLTLSKIFFNRFDNKENVDKTKADEYKTRYKEHFDIFKGLLTLDNNDNGVVDEEETQSSMAKSYRLGR